MMLEDGAGLKGTKNDDNSITKEGFERGRLTRRPIRKKEEHFPLP